VFRLCSQLASLRIAPDHLATSAPSVVRSGTCRDKSCYPIDHYQQAVSMSPDSEELKQNETGVIDLLGRQRWAI
jgi:hypothetical protein